MRLNLIPKHKAKLVNVDIQSAKRGQTEVVPAVALTLKVSLPNSALDMLDTSLLPFLYEKGASSAQQTLDGVDVISDMPALTRAAARLGTLSWDDDQPGSGLWIHQGVTGDGNIKLEDGTVTVKKIDAHEGGACDFTLLYYTEDLDAETLGELAVLKSHELDIELTAPEPVAAQQNVPLGDDEGEGDEDDDNPFPVGLDAADDAGAQSPFTMTPEQALARSVEGVVVTTKRSKLAPATAGDAA